MKPAGMPAPFWEIEEALELIRVLQPESRKYKYHLCLGGGVLNKGRSDKDLDLYFLPMDGSGRGLSSDLHIWLESLWGKGEPIGGEEYTNDEAIYDSKMKYNFCDLRIDVFVLGVKDPKKEPMYALKNAEYWYDGVGAGPGAVVQWNAAINRDPIPAPPPRVGRAAIAEELARQNQRNINFMGGPQWIQMNQFQAAGGLLADRDRGVILPDAPAQPVEPVRPVENRIRNMMRDIIDNLGGQ